MPDFSDAMGNLGAFINITGSDLTPQYKTYAAVVSILPLQTNFKASLKSASFQPHPKVKPMAYASSLSMLA